MKQPFRAIIPLLFSVALLLSLTTTASAAFSDFTDVKGHWAEGTLHQAYDDGILKGYDAKTMAPNRSVTMVQAVTILCRVLHVTGLGDISQFEIPQDAWYAQDVAKGVYAGLLEEQDAQVLNDPIPRGQAFILFGQAFQVVGAQPDLSVLDQFPDTAFLTGEQARAAAALVEAGIVSGSGGALQLDRPLTRAEFATILYRLADQYIPAAEYEGHIGTGSVLSGDAEIVGRTVGDLWFDQSSSNIHLTDVTASSVTIRADRLESLRLDGTGKIGRLVLAAGTGDVALTLPDTYSLETLAVGEGTGAVSLAGPFPLTVLWTRWWFQAVETPFL